MKIVYRVLRHVPLQGKDYLTEVCFRHAVLAATEGGDVYPYLPDGGSDDDDPNCYRCHEEAEGDGDVSRGL